MSTVAIPLFTPLRFEKEHNWTNYPKGVLHFLQEAGHTIDSGMDIYIYGNIPNGSGLSSSSSLELLIGVIVEKLYDIKLERLDLVKIGNKRKMTLSALTLVSWTNSLLVWELINVRFTWTQIL